MTLELSHLTRHFTGDAALDDVRLNIASGEFLALLGPSGSGKTTLLRILAGLDYPDAGEARLDGRDFLATSARTRKVGLVFQHYALFRHLTVAENVAFGLRVRPWRARPKRAEIAARVEALLQRVQLEGLGKRYPAQLSGGQRQRVALARALAVEPDLLLLDEPFGALDAQVRVTLRRWLRHLHEELGLTTVFVTHDQEEALELADRVAVMNHGHIEQVGTPQEIYRNPATPFVCEFIGKVNRILAHCEGGKLVAGGLILGADPWDGRHGEAVVYVRPEHLASCAPDDGEGWSARLRHIYSAGNTTHLELEVAALGQTLEMDLFDGERSRDDWRSGMCLSVRVRHISAFPGNGEPRRADVRERWPSVPAIPSTVIER